MNIKECRKETQKHIDNVKGILNNWSKELITRGKLHDKSKLASPEIEKFTEFTPKLASCTYGSEEYKTYLEGLNIALKHHYSENRHHPEHFRNGIKDMNLIDIIELLADWKSATLRHNDGDLMRSIEINQSRFGYSDELKQILKNTAEGLYKYKISWGCCDGREGLYLSDTIEGLHKRIDEDNVTNVDEKNIFKYGYFREFEKDYNTYHIVIDNGLSIDWVKQNYGIKLK